MATSVGASPVMVDAARAGQVFEGRHPQARLARRQGQPLHGAEADAHAGEGARPHGHGVAVDLVRGHTGRAKDELDRGQDLPRVAGGADARLRPHDEIVGQGHAFPLARRVDREDLHRIFTRLYSPASPVFAQ